MDNKSLENMKKAYYIVTHDPKYNYMKFKDYVIKTFYAMNGKINYMVPASKLVFNVPSIDDKMFQFGISNSCIVGINLFNILIYACVKGCDEEEKIKGLILHVVAHELSHLDQKIDNILYNENESYRWLVEVSNDANSLMYIVDHYDELQKLGYYDMSLEYDLKLTYHTEDYTVEDMSKRYVRVNNITDKIVESLTALTTKDVNSYLISPNFNINNIRLEYIRLDNTSTSRYVMLNGKFIDQYDVLQYIGHIAAENPNRLDYIFTPSYNDIDIKIFQYEHVYDSPIYSIT